MKKMVISSIILFILGVIVVACMTFLGRNLDTAPTMEARQQKIDLDEKLKKIDLAVTIVMFVTMAVIIALMILVFF